ncbi:MAG: hypothetical protein GY847_16880 [Proteobacteria bacterium]|nr:hypothetical protein [Pseudomonadota bacterium]
MNDKYPRSKLVFAALVAVVLSASGSAEASKGFDIYLSPYVGYLWHKFKSFELEDSFIKIPEEGVLEEEIDLGNAQRSVGRTSFYSGAGITLGGSAGIRIFSLGIGAHYSWTPVTVSGYSKAYHYYPDLARAGGRRFIARGVVDVRRVLFELSYGLPLSSLVISLRTRIGSILIDDNGIVMGQAINSGSGFTGDLGASIVLFPVSLLSIGVDGWYGFFTIEEAYYGAAGTLGGLGLIISLEI